MLWWCWYLSLPCIGVWVLRFFSLAVWVLQVLGEDGHGSGSGSKKAPTKKKASVKKSPLEKNSPPVKKASAKKKSAKKGEGFSAPLVPIQTQPISTVLCKEIVSYNPPEFVARLEEVLNRSSCQEERVEEDKGVPASRSATPGLVPSGAQSEDSHSAYADAVSSPQHFEGTIPRSGQSEFPSSVDVVVDDVIEELSVPCVQTPVSEPDVPPSGSAQPLSVTTRWLD